VLQGLIISAAQASCGGAFCSLNTQWDAQGAWTEPGWRLDLRYEYITLDQPRTGSSPIAVGEIPQHHDEVKTISRNLLTSIDYGFTAQWSGSLLIPLVDRAHYHIHNHLGTPITESWAFSEVGDVRVLGRYRSEPNNSSAWGIQAGLKLASGAINIANEDGDLAERTLQPGTGSHDLLLGVFWNHTETQRKWFVQYTYQHPLTTRDEFTPGDEHGLDLGMSYALTPQYTLLAQLNLRHKEADSGVNAEAEDSGSDALWLSPGVSVALSHATQVYLYYQLPLYQYVNGVQLTADQAVSVGVSHRF
jgi:hypothetical protein